MSSVYEKSIKLHQLPPLWSSYLVLAKAFGLYHLDNNNTESKGNPWKFYSAIIFLFLAGLLVLFVVDVILPLISDEGMSDVSLLSKNASLLASFLVAVVMIGYYFMLSHVSSAFRRFYQAWTQLPFKRMDIMTIEKSVGRQTMFNVICVFVAFSVYCTLATCYNYLMDNLNYMLLILYLVYAVEYIAVGFLLQVSTTITILFATLNSRLATCVKTNSFQSISWNEYYMLYNSLVNMVDIADDLFSFAFGVTVLNYLLQLLFLSNYVIYCKQCDDPFVSSLNILTVLHVFLFLLYVLWKAANINVEVKSAYNLLSKFNINAFSTGLQNEMIFSLIRQGTSSIGMHMFHIHLVDREMVTSTVSVALTYLIILVQFKG